MSDKIEYATGQVAVGFILRLPVVLVLGKLMTPLSVCFSFLLADWARAGLSLEHLSSCICRGKEQVVSLLGREHSGTSRLPKTSEVFLFIS